MVGKEIWLEKAYGRKRDMVGKEIWQERAMLGKEI